MKYIWINPVTANMYDPNALNAFLSKHGYTRVEASAHWLETVKEKYKQAVDTAEHTLIDMRCPKIIDFIDAYDLRDSVTIPSIEPILIHCGREISKREDLLGYEKVITTPCQALADLGNSLNLKETLFLPWNQFLASFGDGLTAVPPEESPIPPGFFDGLDCKMTSVTEKQNICDFFENFKPEEFDLVELLYCRDGCHNGDGI
ncbi:hypothetical protein [Anaerotignum sp.]